MKSFKNVQLIPKKAKKKKKEEEGNIEKMEQLEDKYQDGRFKPNHINNHIEWQWSKYPNEEAEMIRLDEKVRPKYRQTNLNINKEIDSM